MCSKKILNLINEYPNNHERKREILFHSYGIENVVKKSLRGEKISNYFIIEPRYCYKKFFKDAN